MEHDDVISTSILRALIRVKPIQSNNVVAINKMLNKMLRSVVQFHASEPHREVSSLKILYEIGSSSCYIRVTESPIRS